MKTMKFSTPIKADPDKIWEVLWNDRTYREWTSAFSPDPQYAMPDGLVEGGRVHFLDGKGQGMYSRIAKLEPSRKLTFEHLGTIKDGRERPEDEEMRKWKGAKESYVIDPNGDGCELKVEVDVADEHAGSFEDMFPKALAKVKQLAEQ